MTERCPTCHDPLIPLTDSTSNALLVLRHSYMCVNPECRRSRKKDIILIPDMLMKAPGSPNPKGIDRKGPRKRLHGLSMSGVV